MNSNIAQLLACLETETSLVNEFIVLLESEAQILAEGGDAEALADSTARKNIYADQLTRANETRLALLTALGYSADRNGLDAAAHDHPSLQSASQHLLERTRIAGELNTSNGTIIDSFLAHNQQALDTLRVLAGQGDLYDASGHTRPGGKAQSKKIKVG
ncbi:flagella synthesis protein FlgN [Pollutimonas thiosulfatoxidans]|uniref:Flagellar biosynthesis protein FlgN n=1 Tax=Pollutimonas thiosulfatoxidans TaxID=2028345 RepID=A0A410G9C8_9BURK|nr:flagellar protein FlgN [Pollutimonas thiosulfatoxidans]QAA92924.1 hypothetical protein CKA81_02995 [Pollutimonas thiosulfatoxidans]